MTTDELLQTLVALEVELHQPTTRRNRERLELLLHPEFCEIGRSGRAYSRTDVLAALPYESRNGTVRACDFAVRVLAEGVALLTYQSAHVSENGRHERHAFRASIWKSVEDGWQMVFHQGTAIDPAHVVGE